MNEAFHITNKPYQEGSLPSWIQISQELPKSWITKRALKAGLVYMTGERFFFFNGARGLNERAKHDPLVVVATFFSGVVDIPGASRIKILNSMFDARHQTERKLWSGENLSTSDIVTNVQLFPEHRLAYTEKTFKIKNSRVSRWGNQQEALYTCLLYTSPSPRDQRGSRMPSSA